MAVSTLVPASFSKFVGVNTQSFSKNKHGNRFLQANFNKCLAEQGNDDFLVFEITEVVVGEKQDRLDKEQIYLNKFFDQGIQCYNLTKEAISREGSHAKNPEETRRKCSEASKKGWNTPGYRENSLRKLKNIGILKKVNKKQV
jgi:hypothetical protein